MKGDMGSMRFSRDRHVSMKYDERRITLHDQSDKEYVIMAARHMAARAGFDETNQFMIATK